MTRLDLDDVDLTSIVEAFAAATWNRARLAEQQPADWDDLTPMSKHAIREQLTGTVVHVIDALRKVHG